MFFWSFCWTGVNVTAVPVPVPDVVVLVDPDPPVVVLVVPFFAVGPWFALLEFLAAWCWWAPSTSWSSASSRHVHRGWPALSLMAKHETSRASSRGCWARAWSYRAWYSRVTCRRRGVSARGWLTSAAGVQWGA